MPASAAQRKAAQQEAARLLTPEGVEREAAQKEAARLLAQEKEAAQKEAARLLVEAAKTAAEAAEGAPQASPQASSCTGLGALETAAYAECDVEHLVCGSWEPATVLERGNAGVLIAYASGGEAFVDDFGDLRPMYRVRAVADKCGALCGGGAAQLVPNEERQKESLGVVNKESSKHASRRAPCVSCRMIVGHSAVCRLGGNFSWSNQSTNIKEPNRSFAWYAKGNESNKRSSSVKKIIKERV